ncbi:MAG: 4-alpha-glucanotransferase [Anaerolineae bacterium]|nr:4-alpha-glucanotransferase [Anaerolineae bacterium]
MRFSRAAGVLLHPTSLPGRYGIGDLGQSAYRFVDFLVQSKQSLWQILPLGPTGYGDSPYQSFSAFAGNPLLISPERLVQDGFLPGSALDQVPDFPPDKVDYGWVIDYKNDLFRQAFAHFQQYGSEAQRGAVARFAWENRGWLDDFALFMALKQYFASHEGGMWHLWPDEIRTRDAAALQQWRTQLADEIRTTQFLQYLFFRQWLDLKQYANQRGIRIVGDVPIFVAMDSADVWANPHLFWLNEDSSPQFIAGVPPDYFSVTGQRWGNPLYRWDKLAESDYAWWAARMRATFTQVDIVRIDHFRGFEAYWEIPATEPTAINGRWVKGPDAALFTALFRQLGELPIIAEDLGVITPEVVALRDRFDFPGMKILQFGFGGERNSNFLPHTFGQNCVVYTGTHDNDTTVGWYESAHAVERQHLSQYAHSDGNDPAWDMIRLALASVADMAVVPLQDVLRVGGAGRMNYPGRPGGNWQWRFQAEHLQWGLADDLRHLTELYDRVNS